MLSVRQVSKREFKELVGRLSETGITCRISKSKKIIAVKSKHGELFIADEKPLLVYLNDGTILPFIGSLNFFNGLKKVYVDEGAAPYVTNGADVMRPGIKEYDEFNEGDIVAVFILNYNTPIALGKALVSSEALSSMKKGKVVKNLHYASDEFWKIAVGRGFKPG